MTITAGKFREEQVSPGIMTVQRNDGAVRDFTKLDILDLSDKDFRMFTMAFICRNPDMISNLKPEMES